jgi:thiosulfate dehydrogenase
VRRARPKAAASLARSDAAALVRRTGLVRVLGAVGSIGLAALLACGGTDVLEKHDSPVGRGRALFASREASSSPDNAFSCSTCHSAEGGDPRILPGAVLGGSPKRPSYWGGTVLDLLSAINACRVTFMDAHDPWTDTDEDAKSMYAYLRSLPDVTVDAVPFTVVRNVADVAAGDASAGSAVYQRTCQTCHGLPHTGEGRLEPIVPRLPEDTIAEHPASQGYTPATVRLVVIEKIRHGGFLGYGGTMPLYSTEALDDHEVGDLLAYLGF